MHSKTHCRDGVSASELLTVAEQSSDLKANGVGERREVVDNEHVRQGRCARDALQLGMVYELTNTNLHQKSQAHYAGRTYPCIQR